MSIRGHDCDYEHSGGHDKGRDEGLTRRRIAKYSFYALLTALAAAIPGSKARAGWGACAMCDCQRYAGKEDLCANCKHPFADHS